MQRVPPHVLRFVNHSAETAKRQTFARFLPDVRILTACRSEGVRFQVTIPKSLCTKKASNGHVVLAASAALAVFDELSSYAVVIKDKTCRFGVSVFLSTELVHDIPAGSEVIVAVNAVKVGRTLGFIDMKMLDKDNRLVAHGRHIKYLPMGWIWDMFTHPSISPYSFPLVENLGSNEAFNNSYVGRMLGEALLGAGNKAISSSSASTSEAATDVVSSTFEMLDVQPAGTRLQGQGGAYDLTVKPQMCNMMGALHGGALAMAIESSAAQEKRKKTSPDHGSDITCIEIHYLSAVKKKHLITCAEFEADKNRTAGHVFDSKQQACAQYFVYWSPSSNEKAAL